MRLGSAELTLVSDGTFRLDGGSVFGIVPRVMWHRMRQPDRRNRVEMGLNCLLIRCGGRNVLVDTGVGAKYDPKTRAIFAMRGGKLVGNLARQGLTPDDIDMVVLTHLHFDHAGGCTRYNRRGNLEPVFRRAVHLAQRSEWQEANQPNERTRASYQPDDFLPLEETKLLELVDGDTELLPGLWVRRTGGHTGGHQMVYLDFQGEKAACLGDVLPTPEHLPPHYLTAFDVYPMETLEAKRHWLDLAEKERWLLVFGHGIDQKAGYLTRRDGRLALVPHNLEDDSAGEV